MFVDIKNRSGITHNVVLEDIFSIDIPSALSQQEGHPMVIVVRAMASLQIPVTHEEALRLITLRKGN
jgi:hypothetical protein